MIMRSGDRLNPMRLHNGNHLNLFIFLMFCLTFSPLPV